jgi:hypothetical protein
MIDFYDELTVYFTNGEAIAQHLAGARNTFVPKEALLVNGSR